MPLIKDGQLVQDRWGFLADDEPLLADKPIVIELERWQRDRQTLLGRTAPLGIKLKAGQHPKAIADDVRRFELIALEFPKFTDGRAYSYARLLRERYGYMGELRAVGQVLRDQLLFMHRCGFDAFEIARPDALEAWLKALNEFSVWYQQGIDGRRTASTLRHRPSHADRSAARKVAVTDEVPV